MHLPAWLVCKVESPLDGINFRAIALPAKVVATPMWHAECVAKRLMSPSSCQTRNRCRCGVSEDPANASTSLLASNSRPLQSRNGCSPSQQAFKLQSMTAHKASHVDLGWPFFVVAVALFGQAAQNILESMLEQELSTPPTLIANKESVENSTPSPWHQIGITA